MPLLHNAKKALRRSYRRAEVNSRVKSKVKTALDSVKQKPTPAAVSQAFSAIDKAVKQKLFHPNKAARLKHQLSQQASA